MRRDSRADGSDILAGSPKQYTVKPPAHSQSLVRPLYPHRVKGLRANGGQKDLDVAASNQLVFPLRQLGATEAGNPV